MEARLVVKIDDALLRFTDEDRQSFNRLRYVLLQLPSSWDRTTSLGTWPWKESEAKWLEFQPRRCREGLRQVAKR